MKSLRRVALFLAAGFLAAAWIPFAAAHEAKVVKVTGAASVQLPGETAPKPLTVGMLLPEGAILSTEATGEVYVETFPGAVATLKGATMVALEKLSIETQGGVVTSQEAMLDLKKGNVISTLDPTKKAINHYGVRTPKGVAAARGTVYGVSVNISGTSVATLSGTVTLNLGNNIFVDIPVGSAAMNDSTTIQTINSALAAAGQSITAQQLLSEAVQAVATNVANSFSAVSDSGTATSVLAAVVSAASAAAPEQAASFTTTAVTAVVATGSSTSGTGTNTALAAVTEAAARAAPQSVAEVTKAAVAVVTSSASTTSNNTVALAAVVEGATRADPAAAATVAAAASAQVVETKVSEAVTAAKSAGKTDAEVATAAQTAATSAQSAVQTVAEASFAVAASASGVQAGTPEAAALANTISTQASAGASTGATNAATSTNTTAPVTAPTATVDSTVVPQTVVTPSTPATPTTPTPSTVITPPVTPVDLPPVSGS